MQLDLKILFGQLDCDHLNDASDVLQIDEDKSGPRSATLKWTSYKKAYYKWTCVRQMKTNVEKGSWTFD